MCGIAGFIDRRRETPADELAAVTARATRCLHHRGPDDSGVWTDPERGLAFGQTRLAIVDLSPAGHQPMASRSGRFVLVFNGEVYNHQPLRDRLVAEGVTFRGHSDTETLVEAFDRWGIAATLPHCVGMFAIAAYDRERGTLTLIRDRLGIKPLYYGQHGSTFFFGSELKALRAHPHFRPEIDRSVVPLYLRHNYIPAPWSIYKGIYKLPPGCTLTLDLNGEAPAPEPVPYWSLKEVAARGVASPFAGTLDDAEGQLGVLLDDAVRLRMIADVPLGAFLSGGIDSSLIVARMQALHNRPVKTFSIGFEQALYDEAPYAKAVAAHLGTDHTEHYVSGAESLATIPLLPAMYDEPFADSSQIPTYLVSKLARRHVTVCLSGDGGDEVFGGYRRYFDPFRIARITSRTPKLMKRLAAWSLPKAAGWWPDSSRMRRRLQHAGRLFAYSSPHDIYVRHMQHWTDDLGATPGITSAASEFASPDTWPPLPADQLRWMYLDTRTYLPDDILVKVDRASMAVALEARVPLIDHRVVEFAWSLPLDYRMRDGVGKILLRRLLKKQVPESLFERPKQGFGVPLETWLRGPLREWGESLLSHDRLKAEGYFDADLITRHWRQHVSGQADWHYHLWDILMFQAWLEHEQSARPEGAT